MSGTTPTGFRCLFPSRSCSQRSFSNGCAALPELDIVLSKRVKKKKKKKPSRVHLLPALSSGSGPVILIPRPGLARLASRKPEAGPWPCPQTDGQTDSPAGRLFRSDCCWLCTCSPAPQLPSSGARAEPATPVTPPGGSFRPFEFVLVTAFLRFNSRANRGTDCRPVPEPPAASPHVLTLIAVSPGGRAGSSASSLRGRLDFPQARRASPEGPGLSPGCPAPRPAQRQEQQFSGK